MKHLPSSAIAAFVFLCHFSVNTWALVEYSAEGNKTALRQIERTCQSSHHKNHLCALGHENSQSSNLRELQKRETLYLVAGGQDTGGGDFSVEFKLDGSRNYFFTDLFNQPGPFVDVDMTDLRKTQISRSIYILDPRQIREKMSQLFDRDFDRVIKAAILAAAGRANWYFMDRKIAIKTKGGFSQKLAVFNKNIGTILDKNIFERLKNQKIGILVHETLRMLTIGFGYKLSEDELVILTRAICSRQKLRLEDFSSLKAIREQILETYWDEAAAVKFLNQLGESMDAEVFKPVIFLQAYASRFLTFISVTGQASMIERDETFFRWAGLQVPSYCSDINSCNYYEEWPSSRMTKLESDKLQKWVLTCRDEKKECWVHQRSGFSLRVSRNELSAAKAVAFCNDSRPGDKPYELVNFADFYKIEKHPELALILNRTELDSMSNDGFQAEFHATDRLMNSNAFYLYLTFDSIDQRHVHTDLSDFLGSQKPKGYVGPRALCIER